MTIIIGAAILINKIHEWKDKQSSATEDNEGVRKIVWMAVINCKLQIKMLVPNKKKAAYLFLLILLSGDVKLNPGPKETINQCPACKEILNENNSLTCNDCKSIYHKDCCFPKTGKGDKALKAYEWLCLNPLCKPNLNLAPSDTLSNESPNRYKILANQTGTNEKRKKKVENPTGRRETKVKKNNPESEKEPNLWKELPKISPRQYLGFDICRACHKAIKGPQQAITCDCCERWIHRKCSDMSTKTYKKNQKLRKFNWNCNYCRQDEVIYDTIPDVTKLKNEDLPETLETLETPKKEILILHMNCRSIINKFEEIVQICKELCPDILCCTETWMDESVPVNSHVPTGYRVIRKDRNDSFKQMYNKKNGGGIAVYYKNHIKVDIKDYMSDPIEEILWLHIKGKESFMLGTIYRASYTETLSTKSGESKLEENIRKASEISNRLIINGDYNVDLLKENNKQTQTLNNIYESYGLQQYIKKPTRIDTETGKPTLIDHVWANGSLNMIKKTGTFTGISDHFGTYMILNKQKEQSQKEVVTYRSFKNYDQIKYTDDLEDNLKNSNIIEYLKLKDVNKATEELTKVMQTTAQSHAPLKEIKIGGSKTSAPWTNEELEDTIKQKNELVKDYFQYGKSVFKNRIKKIANKITHMKRKLKTAYITAKLKDAEGNVKKTWNLLNLVTNREIRKETIEPENLNQEKVDKYNKFFATVGTEIQKELHFEPHEEQIAGLVGFKFMSITPEVVIKLIDQIKPDVAVGNDNINAKLIKDAKHVIAPILARIMNIGYETCTFPDSMKTANIKAIHKKNSTEEIENYRPISILPTMSKIFERDALNQMMKFLVTNNKLSKHQHAYQKGHSTVTCLFEVVNHLYKMIEAKMYTAIASLDLSKAFDSIDHTMLLNKLGKLGLSEQMLKWIKSYLADRKQRTKFSNITSKEETVTSGVPQGSILGPLLFLCFTNDLPDCFEENQIILSYADDTQIVVHAKTIDDLKRKIELVITTAQTWYDNNSMKNNIGKTEILILNVGPWKNEKVKIKVVQNNKTIILKPKNQIKVLGVHIDSKLNWDSQINFIKKKSLNITRNLHRVNHTLPVNQRIQLYKSLIEPNFSYADVIWGGCGKVNAKKLQVVQNFAAKSITGNKKRDSATSSLKKLKFLTLEQRRFVHETVFTHKSLLNKHPENINTQYQNQLSLGNTRQASNNKLIPPKHRTSRYEQSPLYRTITSWNRCPIQQSSDINKHKQQLQKHLIATSYSAATH